MRKINSHILSNRLNSLIICMLILHLSIYVKAIRFNHLTIDEGLSQISVKPIYEDERGFIWIGTRDGLNLFNGNNVQVFKHEKNSSNTIISNRIEEITGNKSGKIFIQCASDVMEYDFEREKFTTLLLGDVTTIYYNKQLYIARGNEILIKEDKKEGFKSYFTLPDKQAIVNCIFIIDHTLWIGTRNMGLFVLRNKKLTNILPNINVTNIYQDSKGLIWVCSNGSGLFQIFGKNIRNFQNNRVNTLSLSSNDVRDCCEDKVGNIWIATFNGLNKYESSSGKFSNFTANSAPDGLTHSSIYSVIKDHQGNIWVGTYFGGVNYFNPEYETFKIYKPSDVESKGLSFPIVGKMTEDKDNNLWIATEGGGLNVFNPQTETFKWYKHSSFANSISHNTIKALYYDSENEIMWIGLHTGGLDRLDLKTNKFKNFTHLTNNPYSLPNNTVRDILPYKKNLIIATENGVCVFNPTNGQCSDLFLNKMEGARIKRVTDMCFDYLGKLWMAVEGEGVFSYNLETKKLLNYKYNHAIETSISSNEVYSIYEDSKRNLWFSTSGEGLDLYRPQTDDFENFDILNSNFKSNFIFQVCESQKGLMVLSNHDLSVLDYNKRSVINFNKENGLPISAVVTTSLFKSRSGIIYLGGIHGLVSFRENDLFKKAKTFSIYPIRLFVNDKEVKANDETQILETSLYNCSEITLPSEYNVFSIEFAASNYIAANKPELLYKLEGFSDTWNKAGVQNKVTYTNLNPGRYTLVIKAAGQTDTISPQTRLDIRVLPPFYRSTLAYFLYLIMLGVVVYYFLRANNRKIKLEAALKYEQKHLQDVEMLNQAKLRFFTNISHEFRTPLTLIIGKIEILLQNQSFTPSVYNLILSVYKSGIQLRELVSELLDFRKQEQGHMKLSVREHNIIDFLYENFLLFQEYAVARKIKFTFEKDIEKLSVWYDSKQLQKVVNNLLSNAFKYTSEGNYIVIAVKTEEDYVIFEVTDSGSGIIPEDIDKVFDRFYQSEQDEVISNTGTGIGLALTKGIVELHRGEISVTSKPNAGTTFSVKLKLGNEHFNVDELTETKLATELQESNSNLYTSDIVHEEEAIKTSGVNKSTKLLIVEDNDMLREMLLKIFENLYDVETASDGEEGWKKLNEKLPDLVLSDILMPKVSGTELCKMIKSNIETCHIPVVLLTARTAIEHNLEGLRVGADDYITKPFNTSILVSRCNNLVNSRRVLQEKFSKQPQVNPQMLATNNMDKALLDKILTVIEKYIDDTGFSIHTFASEMGMSRTNLFAKIKGLTGQTPNDFVTTIRIKKAAIMLLNNPEMNITEISEQLGFNSSRYFSKCFKDQYHVSPLMFRKGNNAEDEYNEDVNL